MIIKKNLGKIKELLTRGVSEVVILKDLKEKLLSGKSLRVKIGIDPTSTNVHIGRGATLLKLRDFQELGHKIVLIIGDFTGVIGDSSDKEQERPALSAETVKNNMRTYIDQISRILDVSKIEIHYNSEWLSKLNYHEISKQANQFSLSEFMARENIKKRFEAGKRVSLCEVLYPLMQGYDSVAIKADIEIGGTDQRFNMLAGRVLQKYYNQDLQNIIMLNLMLGTDGRKMSSSWGNTINIMDDPKDMFGKVMSMPDHIMLDYFISCTRVSLDKIKKYKTALQDTKVNPKDIKMDLAYEITKLFSGELNAKQSQEYFISTFQNKDLPADIKECKLNNKSIVDALIISGLVDSKSKAKTLIGQGGIKIDKQVVKSIDALVKSGNVIQKGKRFFVKVI